jgi:hypothetical protein
VQIYNKYIGWVKANNKTYHHFSIITALPVFALLELPPSLEGVPFLPSFSPLPPLHVILLGIEYETNPLLSGGYLGSMASLCFFMQDKQQWLEIADKSMEFVPLYLPAMFKVFL